MNDIFKIRPAGRHILTVGKDLIQDRYAAIVELVKNAYDADSPAVKITFAATPGQNSYSITISDEGHGMSREVVTTKWLVPSTDDKLKRKISPKGRILQGRKGIGRYAASILGDDLLLETVASSGEKTVVFVEWKLFENASFLDEVDILVETTKSQEVTGTRLTITDSLENAAHWDKAQFDKLRFELKKLIPPSETNSSLKTESEFSIVLRREGIFSEDPAPVEETIKAFPLFDLYDYKISGEIGKDGAGILRYSSQKAKNTAEEIIHIKLDQPTGCGVLLFDIRVYDRDTDSLNSLISRGLKDESGHYMGKMETKSLLNKSNGVGVYRNGFRIRPLGDPDFDWLELNRQRIQNPSQKIGSEQAIGYVQIESDEKSGLIEKSARDGLRDNLAYQRLKEITQEVINHLEIRRFDFRRKAGLSRPLLKLEREFEKLFGFAELKTNIQRTLNRGGIDEQTTAKILTLIDKDETEKNKIAADLKQTVAVYQGQATLGKIINAVLHEGRRPLNYFKNQIPNLAYWHKSAKQLPSLEKLEKCISIVDGIGTNADFFVTLFSRLDPLAAGKRAAKETINLRKHISECAGVFQSDLEELGIELTISANDTVSLICWPQDIYAIITNLIDNSIYWIRTKPRSSKKISIMIGDADGKLDYVDYRDTGPGIEANLIESQVIFEPEFSTKLGGGSGLGLSIAGECAERNGLELKALDSAEGAYFRISPK